METVLLIWLVAALVGLLYGWADWRKQLRAADAPSWSSKALTISLVAVTLQALLFAATWTPLSRNHHLLYRLEQFEYVACAIGIVTVFFWKGHSRWWLLTS